MDDLFDSDDDSDVDISAVGTNLTRDTTLQDVEINLNEPQARAGQEGSDADRPRSLEGHRGLSHALSSGDDEDVDLGF